MFSPIMMVKAMKTAKGKFTVFFEDPYWVGVYERFSNGKLEVCKITFGSEPKDYEVYEYLLKNWNNLCFSSPTNVDIKQDVKINPKRMQREIKKQLNTQGIGTKSQQALKLQYEENKTIRKERSRKEKEEEKQFQFELRQKKKKEKHSGH